MKQIVNFFKRKKTNTTQPVTKQIKPLPISLVSELIAMQDSNADKLLLELNKLGEREFYMQFGDNAKDILSAYNALNQAKRFGCDKTDFEKNNKGKWTIYVKDVEYVPIYQNSRNTKYKLDITLFKGKNDKYSFGYSYTIEQKSIVKKPSVFVEDDKIYSSRKDALLNALELLKTDFENKVQSTISIGSKIDKYLVEMLRNIIQEIYFIKNGKPIQLLLF